MIVMAERFPKPRLLAVLTIGMLATPIAFSDTQPNWGDDDHSHDRARRAVARGEVLPVTKVIEHLRAEVQGDIVATEYEFEFNRWVYEFKVVDYRGHLRIVHVDAATGDVIEEKHE